MSERDHEIAAALYCWESLSAGVTTFVENAGGAGASYPPDVIDTKLDVYDEAGIRNAFAYGFLDREQDSDFAAYVERVTSREPAVNHPPLSLVETDDALSTIEALIDDYHTAPAGRQSIWPGPYLAWGVTRDGLVGARRIAEANDTMTTTHAAETTVQERHVESSVERLANAGYLGDRTLLAHCVHVTDGDVRLLAESDTTVAHNPAANCALGSGIAPVPTLVGHDVTVGLGTDNACINDTINVLSDMRVAALIHKAATRDPRAVAAETVLEMATIDAARAIGRGDDLRSIEAGKKADLVLLEIEHPRTIPRRSVVSNIVYQTTGSEVETVLCDGEIVVEDGRVDRVADRYPEISAAVTSRASDIAERAGIDG